MLPVSQVSNVSYSQSVSGNQTYGVGDKITVAGREFQIKPTNYYPGQPFMQKSIDEVSKNDTIYAVKMGKAGYNQKEDLKVMVKAPDLKPDTLGGYPIDPSYGYDPGY